MAVNIINCGNASLPRSLDVNVSVSKPQAEQTTDLSVAVFVQNGGGFEHGANRVGFYFNYEAVADDSRVTPQGVIAARDFFAQNPRARQMAIGQAFNSPLAGFLRTGAIGTLAAFQAVTNGSFAVAINGLSQNITALNFSTDTTLALVAARIQTAIRAKATGGFTLATVVLEGTTLKISSGILGDNSQVSVLAAVSPASGVDISGVGFLNGQAGTAVSQPGYTPTGLVGELDLISEAARCGGQFVYGVFLDKFWRDSDEQIDAVQWASARVAAMPVVSNSPLAWDAGSTTDIGPVIRDLGIFRAWPIYHDQEDFYPDAAILAIMLSVNYAQKDSTLTAKFKDLIGIPIVGLTQTQWTVLSAKGYNTFTLTGNTSRVFREGTTGNFAWYMDDLVNLDNFAEELQVAEYNVFLRNKKVPYNTTGQALLQDALQQVCERYVFNGAFSDRRVLDTSATGGVRIDPPYTIIASPLELQTVSDRAQRIGPPFVINVNLAGAIHSIDIAVNAFA